MAQMRGRLVTRVFRLLLWAFPSVAFVVLILLLFVIAHFHWGKLYQSHTFDDRSLPEIQIRFSGFLDSEFYLFIVDGWLPVSRYLFWLPISIYPDPPKHYCDAGRVAVSEPFTYPMAYGICWSADRVRLAISYGGWFVGAYDRHTGETIRWFDGRASYDTLLETNLHIEEFLG
jgi:hypothetical protein